MHLALILDLKAMTGSAGVAMPAPRHYFLPEASSTFA
jgi:hypothetical protein